MLRFSTILEGCFLLQFSYFRHFCPITGQMQNCNAQTPIHLINFIPRNLYFSNNTFFYHCDVQRNIDDWNDNTNYLFNQFFRAISIRCHKIFRSISIATCVIRPHGQRSEFIIGRHDLCIILYKTPSLAKKHILFSILTSMYTTTDDLNLSWFVFHETT